MRHFLWHEVDNIRTAAQSRYAALVAAGESPSANPNQVAVAWSARHIVEGAWQETVGEVESIVLACRDDLATARNKAITWAIDVGDKAIDDRTIARREADCGLAALIDADRALAQLQLKMWREVALKLRSIAMPQSGLVR